MRLLNGKKSSFCGGNKNLTVYQSELGAHTSWKFNSLTIMICNSFFVALQLLLTKKAKQKG